MFEMDHSSLEELKRSIRKTVEAELLLHAQNKESIFPRSLFSRFGSLGLTAMSVDEKFSGNRSTTSLISEILEEVAFCDLGPAIFLSVHLMVSGIINKFATDQAKKEFLPRLASGELLGAYALSEVSAGSDAANLKTTAKKTDNGFIISGEKAWITSAGFADVYVVFAREPGTVGKDKISAFIIPSSAPGISFGSPEAKMGCELSPIAQVYFDETPVSQTYLLGEIHKGYRIALSGLCGGRVSIASCSNGVSRKALSLALTHLKEREQFGKTISSFQALQFMAADMKIKLEAAKSLTIRSAEALDNDPESRENRALSSIAKCFASDAAMSISTDSVQLLGAMGYMKESGAEKLMRDAKMLQIVEGTNQIQRMLIARDLGLAES